MGRQGLDITDLIQFQQQINSFRVLAPSVHLSAPSSAPSFLPVIFSAPIFLPAIFLPTRLRPLSFSCFRFPLSAFRFSFRYSRSWTDSTYLAAPHCITLKTRTSSRNQSGKRLVNFSSRMAWF